jgi:hypothetical protein
LSDSSSTEGNRALAGASAPFPRLEEDKCNRKHSRKGRYSAEMNILGYINEHGENNAAELVVTVADCRSSKEFQKKWHSFLTGFVKKRFPSGMWTRERCGALRCWSNFVAADQEDRTCGRKVFCQICGEVARQCEIGWRRTLPAFRHLGHETVVLFEILLGEQSDFPEAANVVREPSGIGGCRNDTQIVGRRFGGFGCESLYSVLGCRSTVIRFGTGNWSRTCGMSLGFGRIVRI